MITQMLWVADTPPPIDIGSGTPGTGTFQVGNQDSSPSCVRFKPDGTKFWMTGAVNRRLYAYTCSTAWDLSTASYDGVNYNHNAVTGPVGAHFWKPDGTGFFMASSTYDKVFQYSCSAWSVSTASYTGKNVSILSEEGSVEGMTFSSDGAYMYIVGIGGTNKVYQYALSTPWDVSTATYASKSLDFAAQCLGGGRDVAITQNGRQLLLNGADDVLYQYTVVSAWDISTATYDGRSYDPLTVGSMQAVFFNPNHRQFFVLDNHTGTADYVREHRLS